MTTQTEEEARVLAGEAQGILKNPAFQTAILALRKQWFAELMAVPEYNLTAMQLHARLQALEAIPVQLGVIINERSMLDKKRRG